MCDTLADDFLLLKYGSPDSVGKILLSFFVDVKSLFGFFLPSSFQGSRTADPSSSYGLFAVYCISSTEMVALFSNSDEVGLTPPVSCQSLLQLYEQLTDYFRTTTPYAPSPMNRCTFT